MSPAVSRGVTSTDRPDFCIAMPRDTADHVAGVEQEPELPGRTLDDLV